VVYLYLTKDFGVFKRGTVERFDVKKASALVLDGTAVVYDPKRDQGKQYAPRLAKRVRKG
jgi:hypothetical protein